jgi:hypothetical protein
LVGKFLLDRLAETIVEYKKIFSHIPFHSGSWQKPKPTASLDLKQQPADLESEWIKKMSMARLFASWTTLKDVTLFLMQK